MAKMPNEVMEAFNNPKGAKFLATIGEDGKLNNVPIFSICAPDEETIAFGDMFLSKTRANLTKTKKVSTVVFALPTEPGGMPTGFQVKGAFAEFQRSGAIFDTIREMTMKTMNRGIRGAGIIKVEEGYDVSPGSEGKKVF